MSSVNEYEVSEIVRHETVHPDTAKKLRAVRDRLLRNPELFNMDDYFNESECGTACCIAGWALVNRGITEEKFNAESGWIWKIQDYPNQFNFVRDLLGLTDTQAENLFFADEWPEPFNRQYFDAKDAKDRLGMAQAGVSRINHFITTGE